MAGLQAKGGKKPRAFQRPSIDLDRSVTREWREVRWLDLEEGDTVADYGVLESITKHTEDFWAFYFPHKMASNMRSDVTVLAFVKVSG